MDGNIFYDNMVLIPGITYVITIFLKGLFIKITTGKIDIENALGSGGNPSVHSSIVVSLTTAIAIKYGIDSDLFAISMVLTVIVIYDAINVRFEAGQHAVEINKTLGEKKYRESLGHLPHEMFVGSIVGILVAGVLSLF